MDRYLWQNEDFPAVHGASEKARLAVDCDQVSESLLLFWEREDP